MLINQGIHSVDLLRWMMGPVHSVDAQWQLGGSFTAGSERVSRFPTQSAAMLVALDLRLSKPQQLILAGKPGSPDMQAMQNEVSGRYLPNMAMLFADGGARTARVTRAL